MPLKLAVTRIENLISLKIVFCEIDSQDSGSTGCSQMWRKTLREEEKAADLPDLEIIVRKAGLSMSSCISGSCCSSPSLKAIVRTSSALILLNFKPFSCTSTASGGGIRTRNSIASEREKLEVPCGKKTDISVGCFEVYISGSVEGCPVDDVDEGGGEDLDRCRGVTSERVLFVLALWMLAVKVYSIRPQPR